MKFKESVSRTIVLERKENDKEIKVIVPALHLPSCLPSWLERKRDWMEIGKTERAMKINHPVVVI